VLRVANGGQRLPGMANLTVADEMKQLASAGTW
jgi:hypothetical protein